MKARLSVTEARQKDERDRLIGLTTVKPKVGRWNRPVPRRLLFRCSQCSQCGDQERGIISPERSQTSTREPATETGTIPVVVVDVEQARTQ